MRTRRAPSLLAAVLVAALVGGLLGTVGLVADAGAGPAVPGCHPGRVVCIGRADGGHTVRVAPGQKVTVGLGGSGLTWSGLRQVGPRLLHQRGTTVVRGGALMASYVAKGVGRTRLQASGAPTCPPGQACPQFIVLWQVRVVVARPN